MPEEHEEFGDNPEYAEPPSFFQLDAGSLNRPSGGYGALIEVEIDGVFAIERDQRTTHFARLTDGSRSLPIIIGPFEAQAISFPLEGAVPDRPLTHDLLANLLNKFGVQVKEIVIDDLWNSVYYAKIYLVKGEEESFIDSRPSDALALAVRFGAPIFIAEGIFDAAIDEGA